ncbi:MAG: hypothetical protein AB8D52_06640 [Gammaproteobacteria bacterium]
MIEGIEAAAAQSQAQGASQLSQGQIPQASTSNQNITTIIQQAEMLDQSGGVNQFSNSTETGSSKSIGEEQSFGDKLIESVSEMDGSYTNIMGHLKDWPNFESYLSRQGVTPTQELNNGEGITHISNLGKSDEIGNPESTAETVKNSHDRMEQMQEKHDAFQAAGIQYSQDSMRWSMSTEFWLSKVRILTSAVSQVSTGLRTLFNAQ